MPSTYSARTHEGQRRRREDRLQRTSVMATAGAEVATTPIVCAAGTVGNAVGHGDSFAGSRASGVTDADPRRTLRCAAHARPGVNTPPRTCRVHSPHGDRHLRSTMNAPRQGLAVQVLGRPGLSWNRLPLRLPGRSLRVGLRPRHPPQRHGQGRAHRDAVGRRPPGQPADGLDNGRRPR